MKKIITSLTALVIGLNIFIPIAATENKKNSDNLHFDILTEYKEDYEKLKSGYLNENFTAQFNKKIIVDGKEVIVTNNILKSGDIDLAASFKTCTYLYPLSLNFLNSKEAFLKEYNSSRRYTWCIPLKDAQNSDEALEFICRIDNTDNSNETILNLASGDDIIDTTIIKDIVDKNNLQIKKDSKVYIANLHYAPGNFAFIISDKIDYVIKMPDTDGYFPEVFRSILDSSPLPSTPTMLSYITLEEANKVNNLEICSGSVMTLSEFQLCSRAYANMNKNGLSGSERTRNSRAAYYKFSEINKNRANQNQQKNK